MYYQKFNGLCAKPVVLSAVDKNLALLSVKSVIGNDVVIVADVIVIVVIAVVAFLGLAAAHLVKQGFTSVTVSAGQHGDPPHFKDKLADIFVQTGRPGAPPVMSYLWMKK